MTFSLTHPPAEPFVCPACGKQVKNRARHAGSARCAQEARKAMIERLGMIEVWFREKGILNRADINVLSIRDQSGPRSRVGNRRDKKRWYAPPEPVAALRALTAGGVAENRAAKLLAGPREELERELALLALAGRNVGRAAAALISSTMGMLSR